MLVKDYFKDFVLDFEPVRRSIIRSSQKRGIRAYFQLGFLFKIIFPPLCKVGNQSSEFKRIVLMSHRNHGNHRNLGAPVAVVKGHTDFLGVAYGKMFWSSEDRVRARFHYAESRQNKP